MLWCQSQWRWYSNTELGDMLLSDESLMAMSEIITVQKKDSKAYWNWC
jgi:hypothetical protein